MSTSTEALPARRIESPQDGSAVVAWLWTIYLLIFLMVLIGGTTRLTGSGLSMVDWHPLMGAIPPLNEQEWQNVFLRYQEFPQYRLVNSWMDLGAFQKIFFWEYLHRLLGRLIGVAVFLPWLYFLLTKRLTRTTSAGALLAIFLGGSQGFLGWYMVMSGLVDVPAVSHFRLAAHLVLALVVSQWILWLILNISAPWKNAKPLPGGLLLPTALLSLLYLQIIFGAFVAGKRAGLMSSTFPDMNGHYLPGPFFGYRNVFYEMANNPLAIHYTHRLLGTIVVLAFLGAGVYLYRRSTTSMDRRLSTSLIGLVLAQFTLGVLTVVHLVPLEIAVAHQGGAVLLLGLLTALLHRQQGQGAHSA